MQIFVQFRFNISNQSYYEKIIITKKFTNIEDRHFSRWFVSDLNLSTDLSMSI